MGVERRATARRTWVFVGCSFLIAAYAEIALSGCSRGQDVGKPDFGKSDFDKLENACLKYTAPSTQIVIEQDHVAARALLAKNPKEYADYWDHPYDNHFQNFTKKLPTAGPAATRMAPPWTDLARAVNFHPESPNYEKGGTLFCGERISPSGNRRLVVVQYHTCPTAYLYFSPCVDIVALVIIPGTSSTPKDVAKVKNHGVFLTQVVDPPAVRIFAGQPDPKDQSHFTVRYEFNGNFDTVDGYLNDDESIELTPKIALLGGGFSDPSAGSKRKPTTDTPSTGVNFTGPP